MEPAQEWTGPQQGRSRATGRTATALVQGARQQQGCKGEGRRGGDLEGLLPVRPQLPSPVSTTPLLGSRVWLPRQSQEQGQESCSKTEAGPLGPWGSCLSP